MQYQENAISKTKHHKSFYSSMSNKMLNWNMREQSKMHFSVFPMLIMTSDVVEPAREGPKSI